jgi:hypothetical protein
MTDVHMKLNDRRRSEFYLENDGDEVARIDLEACPIKIS